jgi:hypothetical protein
LGLKTEKGVGTLKSCKVAYFLLVLLLCSPSLSAQADQTEVETDGETFESGVAPDPSTLWNNFLTKNKFSEGLNLRKGKRPLFLALGEAEVGATKGKKFISSRYVAYEKAFLLAKAQVAAFLKTDMSSFIKNISKEQGGGEPEDFIAEKAKELSLLDKALKLGHKKLDQELKKYDPSWDGTGKPAAEKKRVLILQEQRFMEELRARTQLFLQGASPIFTAEGFQEGRYTVLVGIAWSHQLFQVAQAIQNPGQLGSLKKGKKKPLLRQQIKNHLKRNPNFMALQSGVRVWRNEHGSRAVVSFAATPVFGSATIYKRKATLRARNGIAKFVATDIVANDLLRDTEVIQTAEDDSSKSYDLSQYESVIEAKTNEVSLQGVTKVFDWKGIHPNVKVKMYVVAFAWTPESTNAAAAFSSDLEKKSLIDNGRKNPGKEESPGASKTYVGYEADLDDF